MACSSQIIAKVAPGHKLWREKEAAEIDEEKPQQPRGNTGAALAGGVYYHGYDKKGRGCSVLPCALIEISFCA